MATRIRVNCKCESCGKRWQSSSLKTICRECVKMTLGEQDDDLLITKNCKANDCLHILSDHTCELFRYPILNWMGNRKCRCV